MELTPIQPSKTSDFSAALCIFGSMWFPVPLEARLLFATLQAVGVYLKIVDMRVGQDIDKEVYEWMEMRVDKRCSDERLEILSSHVDRLDEELQATHKSERTQVFEAEAEQMFNSTHRQMQQGATGSCDASGVCTARIITWTVVMQSAMSSGGGGPQRGRRAQAASCYC